MANDDIQSDVNPTAVFGVDGKPIQKSEPPREGIFSGVVVEAKIVRGHVMIVKLQLDDQDKKLQFQVPQKTSHDIFKIGSRFKNFWLGSERDTIRNRNVRVFRKEKQPYSMRHFPPSP